MQKTRVAVLRGGPSDSYNASLETGAHVLRFLPAEYEGVDIVIDKNGVWHERGIPAEPSEILKRTDVVWNALHGSYGADGTIQNIIRHFGVPYTGPEPFSAALSMNADLRAAAYGKAGVKMALRKKMSFENGAESAALELFRTFPMPAVISFSSPAHLPVFVSSFHSLHDALIRAESVPGSVWIEESIPGKLAGCAVVEGYRGQSRYVLLPFEVSNDDHTHPGRFSSQEKAALAKAALAAHEALGLRHYSLSHFTVHPKRGIYILSTESLPHLAAGSRFEKSLEAVGASFPHFLGHIIEQAREK